jgi:hypothetical protein
MSRRELHASSRTSRREKEEGEAEVNAHLGEPHRVGYLPAFKKEKKEIVMQKQNRTGRGCSHAIVGPMEILMGYAVGSLSPTDRTTSVEAWHRAIPSPAWSGEHLSVAIQFWLALQTAPTELNRTELFVAFLANIVGETPPNPGNATIARENELKRICLAGIRNAATVDPSAREWLLARGVPLKEDSSPEHEQKRLCQAGIQKAALTDLRARKWLRQSRGVPFMKGMPYE